MKFPNPNSKIQGNSKHQARNTKRTRTTLRYRRNNGSGPVVRETSNDSAEEKRPFDLGERTARFGEAIVRFAKRIPRHPANDRLINQLVGCGTSIGANYCEANERVSKKDFRNTVSRCVKEAKETRYFLRMIATSEPSLAADARELYREAKELHLIFAAIFRK